VVKNMTQLRPISLCIVFYKIISKVLAAGLRTIVNDVIGPHQSAFLHGRLISDIIPMVFALMHHLKNSQTCQSHYWAVKLDMQKDFDRF